MMFTRPLFDELSDIDSCSFLISEKDGKLFKTRKLYDYSYREKCVTAEKQLYAIRVHLKPFMLCERLCA